jgi:hypothetical protein
MGELIRAHERVEVEQSLKYSRAEAERLWNQAGLQETGRWAVQDEYGEWILYLLVRPEIIGGICCFEQSGPSPLCLPPRFSGYFGPVESLCIPRKPY